MLEPHRRPPHVVRATAALLFLWLAACGGEASLEETTPQAPEGAEALGGEQSEIVGGQLANGDPAVVAFTAGGSPFCSGTLVAPSTVVTAAHCVNAAGRGAPYYVYFGTRVDPRQPARFVRVVAQHAHPAYRGEAHDIAVLRLGTPVTDVTPIPLNTTALTAADVGEPIRHVGFGITSGTANNMGTKRQVTYAVRQVGASQLESGATGKQTCGGDSGGPALMVTQGSSQERLAGVVSFGDAYCRYFGVDTRVDVYADWIRQTSAQWETVAP